MTKKTNVSKKRKPGRPKKDRRDLARRLETYINSTKIPKVAEFAYRNRIARSQLYELFPDAIKRLIDKKESNLEQGGLDGTLKPAMAIFSLKQLGWRDNQEVSVNVNPLELAKRFREVVSASGTSIVPQQDSSVST